MQRAKSYVILVDNVSPSLPEYDQGKVLWLVTNIPGNVSTLSEAASGTTLMPEGSMELVPYRAPCPAPNRQGIYRVRVFAMAEEHVEIILSTSQSPVMADDVQRQLTPHALLAAATVLRYNINAPALL